jgi:hypothetical protein
MATEAPDVLIVTGEYDPTAEFLVPYLEAAGLSWQTWDPGNVPVRAHAGMRLDGQGSWDNMRAAVSGETSIDLSACGVVWYRRPSNEYAPLGTPTDDLRQFIHDESAYLVANLWHSLDVPFVNHPFKGHVASLKAAQLTEASRLGLRVPLTYMGNDPAAIRELWRRTGGRMVVKAFLAGMVDTGEETRSLFTAPLTAADLEDDATLAACPSIWQELIEKDLEIRVTVLGDQVLAAEIHSQDDPATQHDWRQTTIYAIKHLPHALPGAVEAQCRALVRNFHLHYGAIDLILTPAGEYVFLENNPFGQWAWIQELCDLPLAQAHCTLFRQLLDSRRKNQACKAV